VDYSVQARFSKSPARYGEVIGSDLNQLAVASRSSLRRVSSAQNPARYEYSPATRCGEFMQNIPCFSKIHGFSELHLQSSSEKVQKHNIVNIGQNGREIGSYFSSHN
jgi:hypothetical protein